MDEYRNAAIDIIQSQFPNRFVAAPNESFGVLLLHISGTSAVPNGAQFVNVRLLLNKSEMLHAKPGDPTRVVSGDLVFAEHAVLLPPMGQSTNFQLWHQLNLQRVRENIKKTLSDFAAKWDAARKK